MEKIIATIVGIILVLGLIAYSILDQVAGVKDTGDRASIEQRKINMMLQESDIVTGLKVRDYNARGINTTIFEIDGETSMSSTQVRDGGLFRMEKSYDVNGDLSDVAFTQVDLSQ